MIYNVISGYSHEAETGLNNSKDDMVYHTEGPHTSWKTVKHFHKGVPIFMRKLGSQVRKNNGDRGFLFSQKNGDLVSRTVQ